MYLDLLYLLALPQTYAMALSMIGNNDDLHTSHGRFYSYKAPGQVYSAGVVRLIQVGAPAGHEPGRPDIPARVQPFPSFCLKFSKIEKGGSGVKI